MKTTLTIFTLVILNLSLFSQWQLTAGTGTAYGNTLYCVGDTLYAGTDFGAYKTTNNGNTWITINNGFTAPRKVKDFFYADGKLWCAAENNGLFYSTNGGDLWTRELSSSINYPNAVITSGNYIYTHSTGSSRVLFSTNMGANWTITEQGVFPHLTLSFALNGNFIFSGGSDGAYVSFLGATSWTEISQTPNTGVDEIRYTNNKLYAACFGTPGGIWSSTNNGTNWININTAITNRQLWSLHVFNYNILVGTDDGINRAIFFSSNDGTSWTNVSGGLPADLSFSEITSNSTYAFGIIYYTGAVYRRPLSELIGIQPISTEIPKQFSLSQNYPNPFNPVTNINFDVKEKGLVKLAVFNSIGQEIAVILNQELSPGSYKADWNAEDYPSGVYYYKITAGDFSETKKMILIK
ncbi:MAG: T9SS type A sorting domain-containing protein [Ignavibacteria bacterium]|nr:T9SS type A sorting domain-containing protein [Ignavibacteria bacterium]